jgi:hypothetical protein
VFNPNIKLKDKDGNEIPNIWWWEQETTVFDTSKTDNPEEVE